MNIFAFDEVIKSTVACAAWLVSKGHDEIAIEMRDDFLKQWSLFNVGQSDWDEQVDNLIDWVHRNGLSPEISIPQYIKIKYDQQGDQRW